MKRKGSKNTFFFCSFTNEICWNIFQATRIYCENKPCRHCWSFFYHQHNQGSSVKSSLFWCSPTHFFPIAKGMRITTTKIHWNQHKNYPTKVTKEVNGDFSNVYTPSTLFLCHIQMIQDKYLHYTQYTVWDTSHCAQPIHTQTKFYTKNASQIESA